MSRGRRASDNADIGTRPHSTRFSIRAAWAAALLALAVLTLAVPAFAKGPPGAGGGPPPWAGGAGGGGGTGGGPPPWAVGPGGKGGGPPARAGGGKVSGPSAAAQKARKAKPGTGAKKGRKNRAKAQQKAETNPAMTCFGLLDELGEAFAETFGTNQNKANAFGMCVSQEARRQGEDGDEEFGAEEDEQEEETGDCEAPVEDTEAALASLEEDPAAEDECDPAADEDAGDEDASGETPADVDPEGAAGDESTALTCFMLGELAGNARANPFAVCRATT